MVTLVREKQLFFEHYGQDRTQDFVKKGGGGGLNVFFKECVSGDDGEF